MAVSHDMKAKEGESGERQRENVHLCMFALTCIVFVLWDKHLVSLLD